MRGRLLYGALAIAIMVVVAACDETLSDLTGPTPNLEPTFSSIQSEHSATTWSAGASMDSISPMPSRTGTSSA